jgi:hypothetical protein
MEKLLYKTALPRPSDFRFLTCYHSIISVSDGPLLLAKPRPPQRRGQAFKATAYRHRQRDLAPMGSVLLRVRHT